MLICRAFAVMQIFTRPRFGTYNYRGHVLPLCYNVQKTTNVLLHLPKDLHIITFHCKNSNQNVSQYNKKEENVLTALV